MSVVQVIERLTNDFHGQSPFDGLNVNADEDVHGFSDLGPWFDQIVGAIGTKIAIEVGSWHGRSALCILDQMRKRTDDFGLICVDTWLGSVEHREKTAWKKALHLRHGYPQMYFKFLSNIKHHNYEKHVCPIPLDSTQAALYLKKKDVKVSLIFIDAGHDYHSVRRDIEDYWPLLGRTGVLIGDDYSDEWPGVKMAFQDFFADRPEHIQETPWRCVIQKITDG